MTWYKKAGNENIYKKLIDVNAYGGGQDVDLSVDSKLYVNFSINIEASESGIKNVHVSPLGIIEVPVEIIAYDENEIETVKNINVQVDLSKVTPYEIADEKVFTIGDLDLWLDENFNVDYFKSEINIYTY